MPLLPRPLVRFRTPDPAVRDSLCAQGQPFWLADVLARRLQRPVAVRQLLQPTLADLPDPASIPDMAVAVARVVQAIRACEPVVFAVDHDMDGTASAAVLHGAFVDFFGMPADRLQVMTSHRLREGYGLTPAVVERLLAVPARLIITADKGSSDAEAIAKLAAAGKDVVVTDHHALPVEGPPSAALAVVNPTRDPAAYDPTVCGAAVAFLLMAKVRSALMETEPQRAIPSLAPLLDYVAVATIADCVSLRPDLSVVNRVVVRRGMALIRQGQRPCWQVFAETCAGPVRAEDIGFRLAPPIAAAGRLDWSELGYRFLVAADVQEARACWLRLQEENQLRKTIEAELRERALVQSLEQQSRVSIVLFFAGGHSGVHGITASRMVERFGKPCGILAPKGAGDRHGGAIRVDANGRPLASGSFRGIAGFHVRQALQWVDDHYPGLLLGFGGHEGAAGATVAIEDIGSFQEAFEQAAQEQLRDRVLQPLLWVDGEVPVADLTLDTLDQLLELDPWGKDFPFPTWCSEFYVESVTPMGDGSHLRLTLQRDGRVFPAIWFHAIAMHEPPVLFPGQTQSLVYQLRDNWFRGERSLQLQVLGLAAASVEPD